MLLGSRWPESAMGTRVAGVCRWTTRSGQWPQPTRTLPAAKPTSKPRHNPTTAEHRRGLHHPVYPTVAAAQGRSNERLEITSRPRYSQVLAVAPKPSTCSSSRTATLPPSRTASLSVAVPLTTKRSVRLLGTSDGATAAHAGGAAGAAVVGAAVGASHAIQASARVFRGTLGVL